MWNSLLVAPNAMKHPVRSLRPSFVRSCDGLINSHTIKPLRQTASAETRECTYLIKVSFSVWGHAQSSGWYNIRGVIKASICLIFLGLLLCKIDSHKRKLMWTLNLLDCLKFLLVSIQAKSKVV